MVKTLIIESRLRHFLLRPPWHLEVHFKPDLKQEHLPVLQVRCLHPHPKCLPCPPTIDTEAAAALSLILGNPVHSSTIFLIPWILLLAATDAM